MHCIPVLLYDEQAYNENLPKINKSTGSSNEFAENNEISDVGHHYVQQLTQSFIF